MRTETHIDIEGLDQAAIIQALYNASRPFGMGMLHFIPGDITIEQARHLMKLHEIERPTDITHSFDYVQGRLMKLLFRKGEKLRVTLYNEDIGHQAAEKALSKIEGWNDSRVVREKFDD